MPKIVYILLPVVNIFAALENYRAQSRLCQNKPGKHSGRSEAHYNGSEFRNALIFRQFVMIGLHRACLRRFAFCKHLRFVKAQHKVNGVGKMDVVFFACVDALFKYCKLFYIFFVYSQQLCRFGFKQGFVFVKRNPYSVYSYHIISLLISYYVLCFFCFDSRLGGSECVLSAEIFYLRFAEYSAAISSAAAMPLFHA